MTADTCGVLHPQNAKHGDSGGTAEGGTLLRRNSSRRRRPAPLSKHYVGEMGPSRPGSIDGERHNTAIYCVRWTPCGTELLSAARDGRSCLWDVASGRRLMTWAEHQGFVLSCAVSPTEPLVCSTGDDRAIKLWSTTLEGSSLCTLTGHTHKVYCADFTPDGMQLVTASMDALCKVWDVHRHCLVRDLTGHTRSVFTCHVLRPDLVVSGGDDHEVRIWDTRVADAEVRTLPGHTKTVWATRLSSDGRSVLSTGMDADIRDWDLGEGRCVSVLQGHKAPVHAAIYADAGKTIVSAGRDNVVRLWDRSSAECVDHMTGHDAAIYSVALSPDGKQLATCSLDETIRLWQMPVHDQLRQAAASPVPLSSGSEGGGLDLDIKLEMDEDPEEGADPWQQEQLRAGSPSPPRQRVVNGRSGPHQPHYAPPSAAKPAPSSPLPTSPGKAADTPSPRSTENVD
eukprot:TRINITY_DN55543_c0_g1_i1.p1 TRINITY_DN55543_c0_g1~~TRINITY_DN55543_c0_g1_i1.p1  ORF type:complete len:498 (+),score=120.06 TRINITY_DN55543_c0_g1_i1:134-1495(+)